MKFIGAHVSTAGGLSQAVKRALEIKGTAFALFVKNQKQWFVPSLPEQEIENFHRAITDNSNKINHANILAHASYLINLANPNYEKRELSKNSLIKEIQICQKLGLKYLVLHPGSTLKQIGEIEGLTLISECLNEVINKTNNIQILLENTAGQGNNLGYCFEHLHFIIDKIKQLDRIGICIDTCHLFAAGYDLNNHFEQIWQQFNDMFGWSLLKGIHLNNSKYPCGSKLDRHASLQQGMIYPKVFKNIAINKCFEEIPGILETPYHENWKQEIEWLNNG